MRYAIVAAALSGMATASWGPPGEYGHDEGSWGESTTASAPAVYTTSSVGAPVVESSSAPAVYSSVGSPVVISSSSAAWEYTTEVVTAITTFCPEATEVTHGGKTYTATSSETLTITDCPCTISYAPTAPPAYTSPVAPVSPPASAPPAVSSPVAPYPAANGTTGWSTAPAGTTGLPAGSSTPVAPATGGAAKSYSAAGAGILAIFGLVAAL